MTFKMLMTKENYEAWKEYDKNAAWRTGKGTTQREMEWAKKRASLKEGKGERQTQEGVVVLEKSI